MSSKAYSSFSKNQIEKLSKHGKIIHSNLDIIEKIGGGSARCMIAENFDYKQSSLNPSRMNEMSWDAKRPKNSSLDVSKAISILDEKPQIIQESLKLFLDQLNSKP